MKVLVIDDEEDVRQVVRLALQRVGGMAVVEARNGEEGARRAREEQPDAILLDMMMPEVDGAATFQLLRAMPETTGVPIVFLTAKAMSTEVNRLKVLGAKGVVLKPFNPLTLADDLRNILSSP